MDYLVKGGNRLEGTVKAQGAKNAALPLFAASLLLDEPVLIHRVPDVQDIRTMAELLRLLGAKVEPQGGGTWLLDPTGLSGHRAPYELVSKMRASIYVMAPLLAKLGKARVALPGGCAFGPRPVNFHVEGLKSLGVSIDQESGELVAQGKPKGGAYEMPVRSVGATAQLVMAGVLAEGETLILNASMEPEVVALVRFLRAAGAEVEGEERGVIRIRGVKKLKSPGEFWNIPDRIETGTLLAAGLITGGRARVEDAAPEDARPYLIKFREMGAEVEEGKDWVEVKAPKRPKATDIKTSPHPGFPTDMQPIAMAVLSIAEGVSTITETIYPDRFRHAFELARLGAQISVEPPKAIVYGVEKLSGAPVEGTDLRATAGLVVAALAAEGETKVSGIEHLVRGYEDLKGKLVSLGAEIEAT